MGARIPDLSLRRTIHTISADLGIPTLKSPARQVFDFGSTGPLQTPTSEAERRERITPYDPHTQKQRHKAAQQSPKPGPLTQIDTVYLQAVVAVS